jgi:Ferritin-like domain
MAPNRITRGGATLAALLLIALLAGCGGGGSTSAPATSAPPGGAPSQDADTPTPAAGPAASAADAATLNKILARQEAAIEAFAHVIPSLPPQLAHMASYFRAQEQEHVDALLKAMRGQQIAAEPPAETIDLGEPANDRDRLVFLYEVESATIDAELSAIGTLEAPSTRPLLAATAADQAQHLTLLRQALGAGPLASVPEPFESGTTEVPGG